MTDSDSQPKNQVISMYFPRREWLAKSEQDRTFQAWGSVEVWDSQGEKISVDAIAKFMPTYMSRGGIILDSHTNRHVGKVLDWRRMEKNGVPGIIIDGQIFNDCAIDEEAWTKIKKGMYTGMSFGGEAMERDPSTPGLVKDLELWEFTLTDRPANPQASLLSHNMLAKSNTKNEGEEMTEKPEVKKEDATPIAPTPDETPQEAPVDAVGKLGEQVEAMGQQIQQIADEVAKVSKAVFKEDEPAPPEKKPEEDKPPVEEEQKSVQAPALTKEDVQALIKAEINAPKEKILSKAQVPITSQPSPQEGGEPLYKRLEKAMSVRDRGQRLKELGALGKEVGGN